MRNKKIIKSTFLYFMILTLCAMGSPKENEVRSAWAATPVKIDGSNDEWSGESLTLEKKVSVDYAFRNDSENLYMLFVFKDPKFLSSIDRTGMILWLDAEGKKKKNYGIKFQRKMITADAYIALLEKQLGPLPEEKKTQIKSRSAYGIYLNEVVDKKGKTLGVTSGPGAPAFKSKRGKNMMIYEFRIPLKRGERQLAGIGTEPGKNIKIGFEWGGMTKEMRAELMRRRAAGSKVSDRSASLRGNLKSEREGVSGDYSMPVRGRAKKYSFWVDVKLAQNQ